jgi:hypothetical protein
MTITRPGGTKRGWGWFFLAVGMVLTAPLPAQQNTGELNVGVRTKVEPAVFPKERKALVAQGGRQLYAILQVQQRGSIAKLAQPVDAEMIAREVSRQLDLRGFRRTQPKQKPDIVITAEYGRDVLPNPYQGEARTDDGMSSAPTVTLNGDALGQLMRQKEFGMEEKIQRASYEKLFIEVKAWKYPSSPQEKPRVMWVATMAVDDPDHRDLNAVYKDMLAAGAPYFDREATEPEVEVFKPLPEGNVKIGTPTEVAPPKTPGK